MQLFACDHCHTPVFFDNYQCTTCGHRLAFLPDLRAMTALEERPSADGPNPAQTAEKNGPVESSARYGALAAGGRLVRMCENHVLYAACNWAVDADDPTPL